MGPVAPWTPAAMDPAFITFASLKVIIKLPVATFAETMFTPAAPVAPCVPAIAAVIPCLLALTKSTNGVSAILIYHWGVIYTVFY